jgi:hypothetical protein
MDWCLYIHMVLCDIVWDIGVYTYRPVFTWVTSELENQCLVTYFYKSSVSTLVRKLWGKVTSSGVGGRGCCTVCSNMLQTCK